MSRNDLMTVQEAATFSGYTRARLYQLIDDHKLPVHPVKVIEYRVPRAAAEELKRRREGHQAAEAVAG